MSQPSGNPARRSLFAGFVANLRLSLRIFTKSPGFSLVGVLTLGIGIGASAVVFSMMNRLILRPLGMHVAPSLFQLERKKDMSPSQSYPDYLDLRNRDHSFDGLVAYEIAPGGLSIHTNTMPVWLYETSGNYFDVLEIKPYLGRFFHDSDEHGPNSAPYIVVSFAYWHSHLDSDPGIAGRVVQLNKFTYTILGVAPPEFRGTELFFAPDLWVPVVNQQQIEGWDGLQNRSARGLWILGKLKPNVSAMQATADLNSVARVLAAAYPKDDEGLSFMLARPGLLGDSLRAPTRAFLTGLLLLAGLILLAACANLGSLFAARTADRSQEIALRLALGSDRKDIMIRLLTEALLVSLTGGLLGLLGSIVTLRWLSALQPIPNIPISVPVDPDMRTYAAAFILAVVSGVLVGAASLRQVLRSSPYQSMKRGLAGTSTSGRFSLQDALLAVQIAICMLLVTASLVAVRGLMRSLDGHLGFVPQNALLVNTDLEIARYSGEGVAVIQRRIRDAIANIPGVTVAGYTNRVPLTLGWGESTVFADSTTDYRPSNVAASPLQYNVSAEYLAAASTRLLAGRTFTLHDDKDAPKVAIINQALARKLFGTVGRALGSYFKLPGGIRVEVIGVVEDGRYKTLAEEAQTALFVPILQWPWNTTWFVLRFQRDPEEVSRAVEQVLRSPGPGLPFTVDNWYRQLDTALFPPRAASLALGVLGGLGAMLAVVGIFGMAAYSVSKRLRDLGVRIALGAHRGAVLSAALGRVAGIFTVGSLAGLMMGLAAARVLSVIVYQASPGDPIVLIGSVATMLLLALLAAWVPAWRALSADPLTLLRDE